MATEALALKLDQTAAIATGIRRAALLYSRLLLVVGPAGSGKSQALATVSERIAAPVLNVGLDLSRLMLELDVRQRALQARTLLEKVVEAAGGGDVVLLDNTELLFDVSLRQDPLRLLQGVSRNKTVVAAWTGTLANGTLRYAAPGHPEHRRYPATDLLTVPVGPDGEEP